MNKTREKIKVPLPNRPTMPIAKDSIPTNMSTTSMHLWDTATIRVGKQARLAAVLVDVCMML